MTKPINHHLSDRTKILVRVNDEVSFRTTVGKLRNSEVGDFRDFNLALWSAITQLDSARRKGDDKFAVVGLSQNFGKYNIQLTV